MESLTTRNVNDIPAHERAAIEHLLGQPLAGDQQVFIMAYTPGATADPNVREAARQKLERIFAAQEERAKQQGISTAEADAAVEVAMRNVRPRY